MTFEKPNSSLKYAMEQAIKERSLEFAQPQTIPQADMLEALKALTPQQRTELLTDMFIFWHECHTQYALAAAGGL